MRVALVHDWLTGMRGGERVLEAFIDIYPDADVFALFHIEGSVSRKIEDRVRGTSFLQRFPFLEKRYRFYLPLFPLAVEQLPVQGYDLVISTSHCVAVGALAGEQAKHVGYLFTPIRYIYGPFEEHFAGKYGRLSRAFMETIFHYLRQWEHAAASRPDRLFTISEHVRRRIAKRYRRSSEVLYPPVPQAFLDAGQETATREDFYLIVSALVPYKRLDVAIEAFRRNGKRLVIFGKGPDEARLRDVAPPNVEFRGSRPDDEIADAYRRCRGFLFPGKEDLGLTPLEAQACGAPVIALKQGGAPEVIHPELGTFFDEATPAAINAALTRFEERSLPEGELKAYARRFSAEAFRKAWLERCGI